MTPTRRQFIQGAVAAIAAAGLARHVHVSERVREHTPNGIGPNPIPYGKKWLKCTDAEIRAWLDWRATHTRVEPRTWCPDCKFVAYDQMAEMRHSGAADDAWLNLPDHAGYGKACRTHAVPVEIFPWLRDVPAHAMRPIFERGEAFAIDGLCILLPKSHPAYDSFWEPARPREARS